MASLGIFLFFTLGVEPVLAGDPLRGGEPDHLEEVEGFSEIEEPEPSLSYLGRFSGSFRWRFRSDQPRQVRSPYRPYLSQKVRLNWLSAREQQIVLQGVFLRRDKTSNGRSELPATANNVPILMRHSSLGILGAGREVVAGDFVLGWGQGLAMAVYPGSFYRPFLMRNHRAKIKTNTSSYENTGLRGLAWLDRRGSISWLLAAAQTPLNGRLASGGIVDQDLASLAADGFGEWGSATVLARRHTFVENALIGRLEIPLDEGLLGVSASGFNYNRRLEWTPVNPNSGWPDRQEYVFRGRSLGLASVDIVWPLSGRSQILAETAVSVWNTKAALALIAGWRFDSRGRKSAVGVYYLDPYFSGRLSDAISHGNVFARNRAGIFWAQEFLQGRHEWGISLLLEKNLKSDFSSSSASRGPPSSRWKAWTRFDDQIRIAPSQHLYLRLDYESEPYFLPSQGLIARIEEWRSRLEWQWDPEWAQVSLGTDQALLGEHHLFSESSRSRDFYTRGSLKLRPGSIIEGKLVYFNMGPKILSSRQAYLSSPEFYWPGVTLASIANQSLFASYSGQGRRWSVGGGYSLGEHWQLWVKTGHTDWRGAPGAWDSKIELTMKW